MISGNQDERPSLSLNSHKKGEEKHISFWLFASLLLANHYRLGFQISADAPLAHFTP
jgi:hypothetical protein